MASSGAATAESSATSGTPDPAASAAVPLPSATLHHSLGTSSQLDHQSADSLLAILLHLNVLDLSNVSQVSKRLFYLCRTLQRLLGTECSVLSEKAVADQENQRARLKQIPAHRGGQRTGHYRPAECIRRALTRMHCAPNIAFLFHSSRSGQSWYQEHPSEVEALLPPTCHVLSASADDIQCNCEGLVESESGIAVLLASFDQSKTTFLPFAIVTQEDDSDNSSDDEEEEDKDQVQDLLSRLEKKAQPISSSETAAPLYWKIIFVYVCGNMDPDTVLARVQSAHPNSIIVGGVCDSGHVRLFEQEASCKRNEKVKRTLAKFSRRQLQSILSHLLEEQDDAEVKETDLFEMERGDLEDLAIRLGYGRPQPGFNEGKDLKYVQNGIFGVAIGGDVPVRTVVSRGSRSVTSDEVAPTESEWTVTDAAVLRPGEIGHPFYPGDAAGGDLTFHVINRIQSRETGEGQDPLELILSNESTSLIGLRRADDGGNGFDTTQLLSHNVGTGRLLIEDTTGTDISDITSHVGSQFDIFKIDGPAIIDDVGLKLNRLKELVKGHKLLAGLMFSCNGRGPGATYLTRSVMMDAKCWQENFPTVPMLGFYAGGEIGPRAVAGNASNIFQSGQAALQGFTAVFALFIVPKLELSGLMIDDGPPSVDEFIREYIERGRGTDR